MWMAWFSWRFPRSETRCTTRPPEENSTGAVPVVGGVVVPVAEPTDVAAVADEHGGEDRADAEQVGNGGARGPDGIADPLVRGLELGVEAADVVEELDGQVVAGLFDGGGRGEGCEEPVDV
jgi:hypothetical protein